MAERDGSGRRPGAGVTGEETVRVVGLYAGGFDGDMAPFQMDLPARLFRTPEPATVPECLAGPNHPSRRKP